MRLLTGAEPGFGGTGDGPRSIIAVDPTIKGLYGVWLVVSGLVMYISDDEGATWQGATTLVKNPHPGAIVPDIALAAGGGKVAVATHNNPHDFGIKPACPGGITDVIELTYNGTVLVAAAKRYEPCRDAVQRVPYAAPGLRRDGRPFLPCGPRRQRQIPAVVWAGQRHDVDDARADADFQSDGRWPLTPPIPSICLRPVHSTDGDIFRVVQACSNNGAKGVNLFYTPEFLDVVGPTTHMSGLSPAGAGAIRVAWTAQDPTPGSGVAYATVQVSVDGGPWQSEAPSTQSQFIVYNQAQTAHTYTFRVRSRDKVNNWSPMLVHTSKRIALPWSGCVSL